MKAIPIKFSDSRLSREAEIRPLSPSASLGCGHLNAKPAKFSNTRLLTLLSLSLSLYYRYSKQVRRLLLNFSKMTFNQGIIFLVYPGVRSG